MILADSGCPQECFLRFLEESTETSLKSVRRFVGNIILEDVKAVRADLEKYGKRGRDSVQAALASKKTG
jgi:hypothetical protein